MKVTREVIYDLLPGYFAGDVSPDTRAVVDEFLESDPEFRQMMERFREVFRAPRPAGAATAPSDTEAFERARTWLHRRGELRGYVIAFGLVAVFLVVLAVVRIPVSRAPGLGFMAMTFLAISLVAWYHLYRLKAGGRPRDRAR